MLLVFFTKLSFILFMARYFFLLIHFLVVEDYELFKSISHVVSVPLTLECVRNISLSISFFFYFNCSPDDVLCKIPIWADDTALNLLCNNSFELLQPTLYLILQIWNTNPEISENATLHLIIYWNLGNYSIFTS